MHGDFLKTIQQMYEHVHMRVKVNGKLSDLFEAL